MHMNVQVRAPVGAFRRMPWAVAGSGTLVGGKLYPLSRGRGGVTCRVPPPPLWTPPAHAPGVVVRQSQNTLLPPPPYPPPTNASSTQVIFWLTRFFS